MLVSGLSLSVCIQAFAHQRVPCKSLFFSSTMIPKISLGGQFWSSGLVTDTVTQLSHLTGPGTILILTLVLFSLFCFGPSISYPFSYRFQNRLDILLGFDRDCIASVKTS